jgi:hypothetical protein
MIETNLLLVCLLNYQIATVWPRDCALNQKQIVFRIDLVKVKIPSGYPTSTIMTRHPLTLEGAARRCTHSGTTGMTVAFLDPVSRSLTAKIVSLHDTSETASFADAGNINSLDFFENVDIDILTNFDAFSFAPEFPDEFLRFAIGFGWNCDALGSKLDAPFRFDVSHMATLRAGSLTLAGAFILGRTLSIVEAQLNGGISIFFISSKLEDLARTRFNNGDWRRDPRFGIKHLRHPDLTAEYAFRHDYSPYLFNWTCRQGSLTSKRS